MTARIPQYGPDPRGLPRALSEATTEELLETVLLSEEDSQYLRLSKEMVDPQVDAILDVWCAFIASRPQLWDALPRTSAGELDVTRLDAARHETTEWLRRTSSGQPPGGAEPHQLSLTRELFDPSQLVALIYPLSFTLRPFLENGHHEPGEVEAMHRAWLKCLILQVALWIRERALAR